MSVKGEWTLKRILTADLIVVNAGSDPPSPSAVKVATDSELNKDWYVDNPSFSTG